MLVSGVAPRTSLITLPLVLIPSSTYIRCMRQRVSHLQLSSLHSRNSPATSLLPSSPPAKKNPTKKPIPDCCSFPFLVQHSFGVWSFEWGMQFLVTSRGTVPQWSSKWREAETKTTACCGDACVCLFFGVPILFSSLRIQIIFPKSLKQKQTQLSFLRVIYLLPYPFICNSSIIKENIKSNLS